MEKKQIKTGVFAENRRATFDYEILETLEAGLVLLGPEVKSVQNSRIMIAGSQILVRGGSAYLVGADIPPYQPANQEGYDQNRPRQLLLHKNEIEKILESLHQKLTIVPLRVYNKGSRIKLSFGIARRRKKSDKREVLKKKADVREMRSER
jgi:SsrA-binding protein